MALELNNFYKMLKTKDSFRILIISAAIIIYIISLTQLKSSTRSCLHNNPKKKIIFPLSLIFMTLVTSIVFLTIYTNILGFEKEPVSSIIILFACAVSITIGLYFFMSCSSNPKNNIDVLNYLNSDSYLNKLQLEYENLMIGVQPLAKCFAYHNGDYYKAQEIECKTFDNCDASISDVCDPIKGAKLIDFYIASSHQSCHMSNNGEHYVSTEMLKTVLLAGARFIDLNIYTETINNEITPVVRSFYKNKVSTNYILLKDIWSTIINNAFLNKYSDPLMVHLNIKTHNIGAIDQIAKSFVQNINGEYILEPKFFYKSNINIVKEPICLLINKIILCVTGECEHTLLDELVNMHTSHNARVVTAKDVKNPSNPENFVFSNQNIYTIVLPNIDEENSNPENAFTYGCNVSPMNYFNLSKLMLSHCELFKKSSFIMKSFDLQENQILTP